LLLPAFIYKAVIFMNKKGSYEMTPEN